MGLPLSPGVLHLTSMCALAPDARRFVICRGAATNSVVAESSLSPGLRSSWSALAMAVNPISAEALSLTSTTISPLVVLPSSSVPNVQVTVWPDRLHWPVAGLATWAETKDVPASTVAVRTVFLEAAGPLLLTDQS